MNTLEENKEIARLALVELWSSGDLAAADRWYSPDFVSHQNPGGDEIQDVYGLEELRNFVREFRNAFSGFTDSVHMQCAEGDLVATRFISSGTHTGTLWGIEPTGNRVEWSGITIDRIDGDRIVENWVNWDSAGMLSQIRPLRSGQRRAS